MHRASVYLFLAANDVAVITPPHLFSLWCTKALFCLHGKKVDWIHRQLIPLKESFPLSHNRVTVVISNRKISDSVSWLPGGVSPPSKLMHAIVLLFLTVHTKWVANKLSFYFSFFCMNSLCLCSDLDAGKKLICKKTTHNCFDLFS